MTIEKLYERVDRIVFLHMKKNYKNELLSLNDREIQGVAEGVSDKILDVYGDDVESWSQKKIEDASDVFIDRLM